MIVGHHRSGFVVNRGLPPMMLVRIAIVFAGVLAAVPAFAGSMNADEARRFVIGKLFSFNCFEGTSGAGRVHPDGSVSGIVRFGGAANARYVALPPGTLRVRGQAICGAMGGTETCFDLDRIDAQSFRGSIAGLGLFSCQFTRRAGRAELVRNSLPRPRSIQPELAASSSRQ
jgi:hypothetical protein